MSFLLLHSSWIVRNYVYTEEIILVASTAEWSEITNRSFKENTLICNSLGEEYYSTDSPIYYIENNDSNMSPIDYYGSGFFFNLKDTNKVILAKELYIKSKNVEKYSRKERQNYEQESYLIFKGLHANYKKHNVYYWLNSRIKGVKHLLLNQPLFKPLISIKYPFNVMTVVVESFINKFVYILGLIASIIGIFRFRKDLFKISLIFIPIFIFVLFPIYYSFFECREMFIPSYFFLVFGAELIIHLIKNKKYLFLSVIGSIIIFLISYDVIHEIVW
jgi:hypothetical protein